jgi:hypothetical protein
VGVRARAKARARGHENITKRRGFNCYLLLLYIKAIAWRSSMLAVYRHRYGPINIPIPILIR